MTFMARGLPPTRRGQSRKGRGEKQCAGKLTVTVRTVAPRTSHDQDLPDRRAPQDVRIQYDMITNQHKYTCKYVHKQEIPDNNDDDTTTPCDTKGRHLEASKWVHVAKVTTGTNAASLGLPDAGFRMCP